MKKVNYFGFLIAFFAMSFSTIANAQADFYGTGENDLFRSSYTLNGHYFVAGAMNGKGTLSKISSAGTNPLVWTVRLNAPNGEDMNVSDVQESLSGNIIIAGTISVGGSGSNNQIVVMEINAQNGNVMQNRYLNLSTNAGNHRFATPKIRAIQAAFGCGAGDYILHTRRADGSTSFDQTLVMKLDFALSPVWANTYTDTFNNEYETYNMVTTPSGGVVICGLAAIGNWYGVLLELDTNGNIVTTKGYTRNGMGVPFMNIIRDYTTAGNGDLIVTGGNRTVSGTYIGDFAKINTFTYASVWNRTINFNESVLFTGLAQLQAVNGSVYTGYFTTDGAGQFKPRLVRFVTGTGGVVGFRDLGGQNPGYAVNHLSISTDGAKEVIVTTGRPGSLGGSDAYFYDLPTTLTDPCKAVTSIASTTSSLMVTNLTLVQTDMLSNVVTDVFCNPAQVSWSQMLATCTDSFFANTTNSENRMMDTNEDTHIGHDLIDVANTSSTEMKQADNTEMANFSVYPNPANEYIALDLQDEDNNYEYSITTASGALVASSKKLENSKQIDIKSLAAGIYFISIKDSESNVKTARFIKQ